MQVKTGRLATPKLSLRYIIKKYMDMGIYIIKEKESNKIRKYERM